MLRLRCKVSSLLALAAFFAAAPSAQEFRATLSGTVTDSSEATVAGAKVHIVDLETNGVRCRCTDACGNYTITNLPAGTYELRVETAGFKKYGKLEVGMVSETIKVAADLDAGAGINVVLKPGTNDFHGTVYEFARHEIGGYLSGPIDIPKVFSGRKDSFFLNYDDCRSPATILIFFEL
jgi:hypothetical protein